MFFFKKKLMPAILTLLVLCVFFTSCTATPPVKRVTIASKQFTESELLSEMYAQLIEELTDIEVVRKPGFGATAVCYPAIEIREIDMYIEYTGTISREILQGGSDDSSIADMDFETEKKEMYETKGITLFNPIGVNNCFAVAMQKTKAESLGISTLSELSDVSSRLVFSANEIFYTRVNDGYDAMIATYDMDFKSAVKMNSSAAYLSISNGQVDAMVVYSTDSMLRQYDMSILEDDKHTFPDYFAVPMIRNDVLENMPELVGVMDLLAGKIDNEQMQELNYMVDIGGESIEAVAEQFLTGLGLIGK